MVNYIQLSYGVWIRHTALLISVKTASITVPLPQSSVTAACGIITGSVWQQGDIVNKWKICKKTIELKTQHIWSFSTTLLVKEQRQFLYSNKIDSVSIK